MGGGSGSAPGAVVGSGWWAGGSVVGASGEAHQPPTRCVRMKHGAATFRQSTVCTVEENITSKEKDFCCITLSAMLNFEIEKSNS